MELSLAFLGVGLLAGVGWARRMVVAIVWEVYDVTTKFLESGRWKKRDLRGLREQKSRTCEGVLDGFDLGAGCGGDDDGWSGLSRIAHVRYHGSRYGGLYTSFIHLHHVRRICLPRIQLILACRGRRSGTAASSRAKGRVRNVSRG